MTRIPFHPGPNAYTPEILGRPCPALGGNQPYCRPPWDPQPPPLPVWLLTQHLCGQSHKPRLSAVVTSPSIGWGGEGRGTDTHGMMDMKMERQQHIVFPGTSRCFWNYPFLPWVIPGLGGVLGQLSKGMMGRRGGRSRVATLAESPAHACSGAAALAQLRSLFTAGAWLWLRMRQQLIHYYTSAGSSWGPSTHRAAHVHL